MRLIVLVLALSACAAAGYKSAAYQPTPQSTIASNISTDPIGSTSGGTGTTSSRADSEMVTLTAARSAPSPMAPMKDFAGAVGNLFSGQGPTATPTAQPLAAGPAPDPEKLVIEAWIDIKVDDPGKAATAIRARVEADGGRVISENVIGPQNSASSAAIELRIPPAKAATLQSYLATLGVVESRRVLATDVGKTLFDQELALKNLEVTMARLQQLAAKDAPMKELIEIENEMTRVRGQIEKLKGEQRWLLDRVAFATITLTLTREGGPVEFAPHARIHPGPHLSTLTLLDPAGRQRTRVGGGGTIHIQRWLTFDLDVFPHRESDSRAVIGTIGGALYSSFLGAGRREFLNPYLGFRGGFGHLSGENTVVAATELGLELYKQKYVQVDLVVRGVAFFRDEKTDAALQCQLGFEVPF